jgi:hypothetical protein
MPERRSEDKVSSTTRDSVRDRLEEAKERMEDRREKMREHITSIADKRKQEMAAKLSEKFDKINTEWTGHFTKQLDRLDAIVAKIVERAAAGRGTADTAGAVQKAKDAIAAARTAVAAQAAKTYVVDISTLPVVTATSTNSGQDKIVQGLRKSFQTLHTGLFKDLFALRDGAMKDARRAVAAAAKTLEGRDSHATSTTPI